VIDLMEALKASVDAVKVDRKPAKKSPRRRITKPSAAA
jgi:non-homologous end joining protein Ku